MSPEVVFDGVFAGAAYALLALGLAIVFQPTRIMNFAQGEAFVLGAAVAYQVSTLWKLGWAVALAVAIASAIVLGYVMERLIIIPVRRSGSRHAWIIATLAVAMVLQAIYTITYINVDSLRPEPMVAGRVGWLGGVLDWQELFAIVAALLLVVAYDLFLRRTGYGQAIRATSHNPDTAVIMGIPVARVVTVSFIIAAVITALAGFFVAPVLFITPASGLLFTIKGFTAAVIGGVGSPRGALLGGLLVGLLDTVVRTSISGTAGNFAVFVALAVILVVFPSGLFGKPMEAH